MILKQSKTKSGCVSRFDLLGVKETALCKAFAYTLANDKSTFSTLMKKMFNIHYASKFYESSLIEIEKDYKNIGRTDLEIKLENPQESHHIIFECKKGKNKVSKKQNEQYLKCFDKSYTNKILCFLTQDVPSNRIIALAEKNNIKILYFSWGDVVSFIECKNKELNEFVQFFNKGYKMKTIKEILIQDMGKHESELKRLFDYGIYRTAPSTGIPLYFAPHFTKNALGYNSDEIKEKGIQYLYEVVGVLTGSFIDVENSTERLQQFAELYFNDKNCKKKEIDNQVAIWKKGISYDKKNNQKDEYTFYFLGKPTKLPRPIQKDSGIEKGRGKNWIAASVPKNRCASFKDFINKMIEQS